MLLSLTTFLFILTTTTSTLPIISTAKMIPFVASDSLRLLRSYKLTPLLSLHILQGSVVDFGTTTTTTPTPKAAIVNAANEGCLGGGGVDGAISEAGGEALYRDRLALPIITQLEGGRGGGGVRCPTGRAVVTGPNQYGKLQTPYVIHAVGPNYWDFVVVNKPTKTTTTTTTTCSSSSDTANENTESKESKDDDDDSQQQQQQQQQQLLAKANALLQSAYQSSLDLANQHELTDVAFALLSAGIFRGPHMTLHDILFQSVSGIQAWAVEQEKKKKKKDAPLLYLRNIYMCGFSAKETQALEDVCSYLIDGSEGAASS